MCLKLLPTANYFQILVQKKEINLHEEINIVKTLSPLILGDAAKMYHEIHKQINVKSKLKDYY